MIPDLPDVVAAHEFLVRRYALSSRGDELVFFGALCEAGELAKEPADEPAAIFFAFARRAAKLGDAWSTLPDLLAFHQTSAVGYRLSADSKQLTALRGDIAEGRTTFAEVALWFAVQLVPISPPRAEGWDDEAPTETDVAPPVREPPRRLASGSRRKMPLRTYRVAVEGDDAYVCGLSLEEAMVVVGVARSRGFVDARIVDEESGAEVDERRVRPLARGAR